MHTVRVLPFFYNNRVSSWVTLLSRGQLYHLPCASGWIWRIGVNTLNGISKHYSDVIMGAMASQITSLTIVYSTFYSGADWRKHHSSTSLAFVRGIHHWPGTGEFPAQMASNAEMFPLDDVIMSWAGCCFWLSLIYDLSQTFKHGLSRVNSRLTLRQKQHPNLGDMNTTNQSTKTLYVCLLVILFLIMIDNIYSHMIASRELVAL